MVRQSVFYGESLPVRRPLASHSLCGTGSQKSVNVNSTLLSDSFMQMIMRLRLCLRVLHDFGLEFDAQHFRRRILGAFNP
jgi:hypothetical protein